MQFSEMRYMSLFLLLCDFVKPIWAYSTAAWVLLVANLIHQRLQHWLRVMMMRRMLIWKLGVELFLKTDVYGCYSSSSCTSAIQSQWSCSEQKYKYHQKSVKLIIQSLLILPITLYTVAVYTHNWCNSWMAIACRNP